MTLSHLAPLARDRSLRGQLAVYVLARLPSGMMVLTLLVQATQRLGSLSGVGATVSCYTIAVAATAPLVGRLIDRISGRRVLPVAALVHLAGISIVADAHGLAPLCVGSLIGGLGLPPTAACLRARWRALPPQLRGSVFAVDGVILESAQVIGPLLVSALIAAFSPAAALLVAAGCSAVAAVLTAARLPDHVAPTGRGSLLGPLRVPSVDLVLAVLALVTAGIAIVEVSVVAYAGRHHHPALAGLLFAAMSVGSVAGGLIFAGSRRRRAPKDVLPLLCLASAAGYALLLLTGSHTWLLVLVLVISNAAVAPAFATTYAFLSEVAPEHASAETFTWVSSSNFVAISAGTALGGLLLTHTDQTITYVVSTGVLFVSAGAAAWARSTARRSHAR